MKKEEKGGDKLYQEFKELYKKGEEIKIDKFLKDNFKKLPRNTKNKIILFLLIKNLANISKNNQEIIDLQRRGLKNLDDLQKSKDVLENELKIISIKERLNNRD